MVERVLRIPNRQRTVGGAESPVRAVPRGRAAEAEACHTCGLHRALLSRYVRSAGGTMPRLGPGERATIGAAVLAAAEVVDTRLVRDRLARFAQIHARYLAAQRTVAAAVAELTAAEARLAQCDRAQRVCITRLAGALIADGAPRRNPFRALGLPSPALLPRLAVAAEVRALDRLVQHARRAHRSSRLVQQHADRAAAAASATRQAIATLGELRGAAAGARVARDALAPSWDRALGALRRGTQAAADDGAPHLHGALFGGVSRRPAARRRARPAATSAARR